MVNINCNGGVTDIHLSGNRLEVLAEIMCISDACAETLSKELHITRGQALILMNESIMQGNSHIKGGDKD